LLRTTRSARFPAQTPLGVHAMYAAITPGRVTSATTSGKAVCTERDGTRVTACGTRVTFASGTRVTGRGTRVTAASEGTRVTSQRDTGRSGQHTIAARTPDGTGVTAVAGA